MREVTLTGWPATLAPSREELHKRLVAEGLKPTWWSNGPGDRYAPHEHSYDKVLYCARGEITFVIEPDGAAFDLRAGDRLDIPAGTRHSAVVGNNGVTCVEAAVQTPGT